jgi:hypothetical protein
MTTIEVTKFLGAFGAYFGFSMLPAAVAFVRRKTARWFLFTGGLFLLARWTLNCFNLMPLFSWRGYEPVRIASCVADAHFRKCVLKSGRCRIPIQ